MIFCATDNHADMVKRLLDVEFKTLYGDNYNQEAVAKITGKSDKVSTLISRYKNERYPNIAITVDLLTTGIDVPKICNLVFMRRVKSRILYEQMMGRATRRCDEIGKTVFRIYDPVDIYAALAEVNTMQPLVKNPDITLEQLVGELSDPQSLEQALAVAGDEPGQSQADTILSQLSQKLMRVLRKAEGKADRYPPLKQKLAELGEEWGVAPDKLHQHLHQLGPKQASDFLRQHITLLSELAAVQDLVGSEYRPVISDHQDKPHPARSELWHLWQARGLSRWLRRLYPSAGQQQHRADGGRQCPARSHPGPAQRDQAATRWRRLQRGQLAKCLAQPDQSGYRRQHHRPYSPRRPWRAADPL